MDATRTCSLPSTDATTMLTAIATRSLRGQRNLLLASLSLAVLCLALSPLDNLAAQDTARTLGGQPTGAGQPTGGGLGGDSIYGGTERLPAVAAGELALPPIMAVTTDINKIGNGSAPKSFREESETPIGDLPEAGTDRDAGWVSTTYQFAAANTFSNPRYFEDVMLERHGHERYPHLQPMVSGARFFATFPMLPYLMTVRPPCECESQMGYFRPGSCVYPYRQRPPYDRNAVIVEACSVARGVIAIP